MAQFTVIIREMHTFSVRVEAEDANEARGKGLDIYDHPEFETSLVYANAAVDYESTTVFNDTTGVWEIEG